MRALILFIAIAAIGCAPLEGLRETPAGDGPMVYIDWDAEPLPEVPFPNDLAARTDETSPTGLRLNFSREAPTQTERDLRTKADQETGFGIYAPIMVRFEAPLDLDDILARHGVGDADFTDDAVVHRRSGNRGLGLAGGGCELIDGRDDLPDRLVPSLEGGEDFLFGDLKRSRFDHDDRVVTSGNEQVEATLFAFRIGRVDQILAIHEADPDRGDSPLERN